jgi:undecaprenyl-diphosphatase
MRSPSGTLHFLAASLPLAVMMAIIFAVWGAEHDILRAFRLHKADHHLTRQIMFWVTDYTNLAVYLIYAAMLAWGIRNKRKDVVRMVAAFALIQFLICFGLVNLIKIALGRPRPMTEAPFYDFVSLDHFYHSLPSGHTAEIFGAVTPLVLLVRRWPVTIVLGVAAALVGFSRIYLYQHYPSDVAFGWLFGAYSGLAVYTYWKHVLARAGEPIKKRQTS